MVISLVLTIDPCRKQIRYHLQISSLAATFFFLFVHPRCLFLFCTSEIVFSQELSLERKL